MTIPITINLPESLAASVERYELLILISLYQMGQLRKSEGLAEAVKRGIKTPLSP
ncbi:MAG: hypothetical protein HCA25_01045 [Dolichospermum sp. DET50]|jgi:hypothetical protein|nr:hypothetical protein [Dolichospermum sp. DET66]MBS3030903.1 hypothetical protein [Dolichospermum sp. DET67]MBS3036113.1 hypothetical protein [Dolichospermum sp. DET50]QSX68190.1 MAG: hypothetical protein EZY12_00215 [Dolichospermum sp. DET69]